MPREVIRRTVDHLTSPISVRGVLGVIMFLSVLGFAYAVFNEKRIRRMNEEHSSQIQQVNASTSATHSKIDNILNQVDSERESTKQEIEFMREVNAALSKLNERLAAYTASPPPTKSKPKAKRKRKRKRVKACTKEVEKRTSYGNTAVLVERFVIPVPCQ
jgi:hypothetical protein